MRKRRIAIDTEQLLTVQEVAAKLSVTVRTVSRWCESGRLRNLWIPGPTEKGRGLYRIPASALLDLMIDSLD